MDIQIKQVSSLETIFSYETATHIETAAAFRGERFSYQIVMLPEKSFRYQVDIKMPESVGAIKVYKLKEVMMDTSARSYARHSFPHRGGYESFGV